MSSRIASNGRPREQGSIRSILDGVFAFAFTLLALGFVLPELHAPSNRELSAALLRLWPISLPTF